MTVTEKHMDDLFLLKNNTLHGTDLHLKTPRKGGL